MKLEQLSSMLNEKGVIKFKLYSLDYTIEKTRSDIVIYVDSYKDNKKTHYATLEELLNNYNVYNEPLIDLLNNIYLNN